MMDVQKTIQSDNASTMKKVTNLVTPADPDASNEPQQVTQWIDDTAVQRASLPSIAVPSTDLIDSGTELRDHNIYDILSRPVKLGDVLWTDAQTADSSPIATYSFPEDLVNASSNISDKISHFMFLRAHVVIRFVVNANTFQAGRLVAYFAPFSSASEIGDRVLVNDFMSARTVFPRVVLDAGSGNSGELTIPYVSYLSHYDLPHGIGDMGKVYLVVLNPLQTGNAYVSIFARFTNISLEIPTAVPSSLGTFGSLYSRFKTLLSKGHRAQTIIEALEDMPRAQVGEATSVASSGVLSSFLQGVSSFSSSLASIPSIATYVTPISWIAAAAANVASYFGLSKPTNLTIPKKYVNLPGFGMTNVDCVDSSVVLGASCENEIGTRHDVFGSAQDEMDIAFICQHESFLYSFKWSNDKVPGSQLTAFNVSPGVCMVDSESGNRVYSTTAVGFITSIFDFWRGSLKFKIQVTKTAYHSGRLRVSFVPGGMLPTGAYDYNQGYSEIVDLRTSDEIVFVVPFVSNTIWKKTALMSVEANGFLAQSTGVIVVEVMNALRHPESVSSSLDCNVWISGGDDIQFAVPNFHKYMPVTEDATVMAYGIEPLEVPRAQVLGQFQDVGFNSMNDFSNQMFTSKPVPPIDASATTIGEPMVNLRQLIKRFGIVYTAALPANSAGALVVNTGYFGPVAKTSAPSTSIGLAPIDYISWIYRFYRGGQRYKVLVDQPTTGGTLFSFSQNGVFEKPSSPSVASASSSIWPTLLNSGTSFFHQVNIGLNNLLEVLVPYYSNTFISLIRSSTGGAVVTQYDDTTSNVYFVGDSTAKLNGTVWKAAADDFSFGWLIGPPKLMERPIKGAAATIVFSGGTSLSIGTDGVVAFKQVGVTPALADGEEKRIVYAGASTFTVVLNDESTLVLPFVGNFVKRSGTDVSFTFVVPDSSQINQTATIASLKGLPDLEVVLLNA